VLELNCPIAKTKRWDYEFTKPVIGGLKKMHQKW
jgi:hypothetical protein